MPSDTASSITPGTDAGNSVVCPPLLVLSVQQPFCNSELGRCKRSSTLGTNTASLSRTSLLVREPPAPHATPRGEAKREATGLAGNSPDTHKQRFWAARTLQWATRTPLLRGAGDASIYCYAVYCPSRARWAGRPPKRLMRTLCCSRWTRDDLIQRGNVAAILAGDFNRQVQDSFLLRQWRFDGPLYDVSFFPRPTCAMHPLAIMGIRVLRFGFLGLPMT